MQTKTITYKRILNLGNYESKHLERTIEIFEFDDIEAETSHLMEFVERKIREGADQKIESEIRLSEKRLQDLKKELREVEKLLAAAKSEPEEEPDTDDIPFDPGEASTTSDASLTSEIADSF